MNTESATKSGREAMNQAQRTGEEVKDRATKMGEQAKEGMRSTARNVTDTAYQAYDDAREAGSHIMEQVKSVGQERTKQIERRVRNDPMKAILLSAGVGLLVGMLIKR